MKPTVSFVVPVFNKGHVLSATLASLLAQGGDFISEYIFVDDASTDNSLEILLQCKDPRVKIIQNDVNCGPAVRVNQGARVAKGEFLQFVDADDILCLGATSVMLKILQRERADVIYGKWLLTRKPVDKITQKENVLEQSYVVSDRPLRYVLTHKNIVRMVLMTTRDCFLSCGGCDETVFVQDESLPLRLAYKARRFVDYSGVIVHVPSHDKSNLSSNKIQQHHDGFCVFRNALRELKNIDDECRRLIYKRAISICWKHYRRNIKGTIFSKMTARYLWSKIGLPTPSEQVLDELYEIFKPFQSLIRTPNI